VQTLAAEGLEKVPTAPLPATSPRSPLATPRSPPADVALTAGAQKPLSSAPRQVDARDVADAAPAAAGPARHRWVPRATGQDATQATSNTEPGGTEQAKASAVAWQPGAAEDSASAIHSKRPASELGAPEDEKCVKV
jgi:hypothetical protein